MTLAENSSQRLDDPALSYDERAGLRCRMAEDLEERGQYEAARGALAGLWRGVGERPHLEGLTKRTAAEVLLRVGTLSNWFTSLQQLAGPQAASKDLISESISIFQALGETAQAASAQSSLGTCYWREGAFDEARVIYAEALKGLTDEDAELKAKIYVCCSMVESCSGRYNDALRILTESVSLFEASTNHALKGRFHNELACVLTFLGKTENRQDYTDRAIIEYTAASYHFEQAGHENYLARTENNLGYLLYTVNRYAEAQEHLKTAWQLFNRLKDRCCVAQVDETRARLLLAQDQYAEALSVIRGAVLTLEKGGEQNLLAEALTTMGTIQARLGEYYPSLSTLQRAINLAEQAGATEDAARAALTLMEEHAERLPLSELFKVYERADDLLAKSQDAEAIARLRACARSMASLAQMRAGEVRGRMVNSWAGFCLPQAVKEHEAQLIRQALIEEHGMITRAAHLLGITHQRLSYMLESRHQNLLPARNPAQQRRKSIIAKRVTTGSRN